MSKWRGFFIESVKFVNPKGFIGWMKFLLSYPQAYFKYKKLESKK